MLTMMTESTAAPASFQQRFQSIPQHLKIMILYHDTHIVVINKPIYKKTAAYGHFGRQSEDDGSFSWEKTDLIKYFQSKV